MKTNLIDTNGIENADRIRGLSFSQKEKYRNAIAVGYFNGYDADPRAWRHSFVGTFIWKYPKRVRTMDVLTAIVGQPPVWDDITDMFLKDFVSELSESGLAPSSVRTMCAELKAVLNANYRRIPCQRDDFMRILSVRGTASQAVYLTRDEMERIVAYQPVGDLQRYVHRNFCVEMLTGARLVDAEQLSLNNCDPSTSMLSYVPKKTPGIIVRVPVDERLGLRRFLADTTDRPTGVDVFNETARTICRNCGITDMQTATRANRTVTTEKWRLVSSHTARRSFATNLFLAGVSLEDIAAMMGHGKNIETTKRYVCAERKVTPAVASYFRPVDDAAASQEYDKAYNRAIDDVIDILDTTEILQPDGLVYQEIRSLRRQ